MKCSKRIQVLGSALFFSLLAQWGAVAQGQVETIDPNPTMPRDVGGRLTYRGFSDSQFRLGRTSKRDENPAETLLKSIDGTNYGRASGHSIFSPKFVERTSKNVRRRPLTDDPGTAMMYLSRRGSYEGRANERARGISRTAEHQRGSAQSAQGRRPVANSVTPKSERQVRAAVGTTAAARVGQGASA